jgi:transcriptional regulator NrdR family protein
MRCPECNSDKLKVTDSRYYDSGVLQNTKKRKRLCKDCNHSFTSFELCYTIEEIEKVLRALEQKRWKAHWSNEEDKQLVEMYKDRYSIASIAANLGRNYEAVRKRINILGISDFKNIGG